MRNKKKGGVNNAKREKKACTNGDVDVSSSELSPEILRLIPPHAHALSKIRASAQYNVTPGSYPLCPHQPLCGHPLHWYT
jgi:hypothetical protein